MGQIADVLCQMFFFILIFAISGGYTHYIHIVVIIHTFAGYYLFATDSPTNFVSLLNILVISNQ